MNVVAARLGLDGDQSSDSLAKFGVVVLKINFRLGNCVEVGIDDDDSQNGILVISSIQLVAGSAEVLAVDEDLLRTLRILGGCVSPTYQLLRARREQLELREVAVEDRQLRYILLVELDGNVGTVGFELRRFRRHLHGFSLRAGLQRCIELRACIGRNLNVVRLRRCEALRAIPFRSSGDSGLQTNWRRHAYLAPCAGGVHDQRPRDPIDLLASRHPKSRH